jgi:hypothetical protein
MGFYNHLVIWFPFLHLLRPGQSMEADSAKFWVQLAFTWGSGTFLGETGRFSFWMSVYHVCVSIPYMYIYIHILYIYI